MKPKRTTSGKKDDFSNKRVKDQGEKEGPIDVPPPKKAERKSPLIQSSEGGAKPRKGLILR